MEYGVLNLRESRFHGLQLSQYVYAISVFFDHAIDAANLSLYPTEPFFNRSLFFVQGLTNTQGGYTIIRLWKRRYQQFSVFVSLSPTLLVHVSRRRFPWIMVKLVISRRIRCINRCPATTLIVALVVWHRKHLAKPNYFWSLSTILILINQLIVIVTTTYISGP